MSSTIIAGTDGSERGIEATAFARRLAQATGARLLVASVHPLDLFTPRRHAAESMLRQEAERRLAATAEALGGAEWEPVALEAASAARGLHELAEREEAALVVVGSTHRGRLGRVLPGSVGERLLHGAPCPVAMVPRGHQAGETRRVAVAFDGSEEAQGALSAAEGLARTLGASLRVVTVVERPDPGHPAVALDGYAETLEAVREDAEQRLADAVRAVAVPEGVAGEQLEGDAVAMLVAVTQDVDLMVVGSRGYGPARRVLLGGVSGPLVNEAACPVVVVPRAVAAPLAELLGGRQGDADPARA